ncbi:DNA fragmentation factor subunit alpha isoform X3 [Nomia melanderi]|uniref:DNA fragmentation factor subunit alpha isoform X3 n=1 Tax=Nomia melanderi TaxID=2448451 RepID=UPI00130468F4|nr:DNA fragmentation factor subunit alpha-like isoform X3 [Nomia melanderi]XP_031839976.1 DNA fragmentation factor subunit alpha-like isoform X3 [Nomia melanderi]XP_031839977.1 DNA fragmentation factor subunit alpha-like isoform X3 [Nomia melanderi]
MDSKNDSGITAYTINTGMSETAGISQGLGNPYKIVDHAREKRKGITASSLKELTSIARSRLSLPLDAELTIVLEQDGTEVDDEEYFATLERNTSLMVLHGDQKWIAAGSSKTASRYIVVDDVDNIESGLRGDELRRRRPLIEPLVSSLHGDPSHISLLGGSDLELLSDMDPDSLADIVPDRIFLEQLKEASGRFLAEKRQAQESMALLQMYANGGEMERA